MGHHRHRHLVTLWEHGSESWSVTVEAIAAATAIEVASAPASPVSANGTVAATGNVTGSGSARRWRKPALVTVSVTENENRSEPAMPDAT